jgi:hypothetical protein
MRMVHGAGEARWSSADYGRRTTNIFVSAPEPARLFLEYPRLSPYPQPINSAHLARIKCFSVAHTLDDMRVGRNRASPQTFFLLKPACKTFLNRLSYERHARDYHIPLPYDDYSFDAHLDTHCVA